MSHEELRFNIFTELIRSPTYNGWDIRVILKQVEMIFRYITEGKQDGEAEREA